MKFIRAALAAVLGLALGGAGFVATSVKADAHTPEVSATCKVLDVNLANYQTDPGHPETFKTVHHDAVGSPTTIIVKAAVVEVSHVETQADQRFSWTGGPEGPGAVTPPDANWQGNTHQYNGTDPLNTAFQAGQGNASWFFWTTKDVKVVDIKGSPASTQEIPNPAYVAAFDEQVSNNDAVAPKVNHVTVLVNEIQVESVDFGASYVKSFPVVAGDTYKVIVRAWDDPDGSKGWSKNFRGVIEKCVVAPVVTLGYSTGCGVITLTTTNNEAVPATWYYGLKGSVDGVKVVSAVQQGPGTKTTSYTFAENQGGGSVDVAVTVYASTEQNLLPAEWPFGFVKTVKVDTKCAGDQPQDKVWTGEWANGEWGCGDTTVDQTRKVVTTPYVLKGREWVLDTEHAVTTYEHRNVALTEDQMLWYQNTDSEAPCYVEPKAKDATFVVTTDKWACNDKTAVTSTVTTTYSFLFDKATGTYGDAIATVGTPVAGVRDLTASEFVACAVPTVVTLPNLGGDASPWGIAGGALALLSGLGLVFGRKRG